MKASVLVLGILPALVACSTFERRVNHRAIERRAVKNAADQANIHGEEEECKWYEDRTLAGMKFPKQSQIASIMDGDSDAQKIWKEIRKSGIIPGHVKVKAASKDHRTITDEAQKSYDKSDPDCWWSYNACTKPKADKIPEDISQCPEPDTWGLTFDDGPNCSHNGFYDFLQEKKLRATLFYIGTYVVGYPYQAQRGATDGHDICVHTWSHRLMTSLSNEQVFAELYYTAKAIKAVTGVTPRCWRPPFGDTDDRVRAIAAGLGMRTILWQEDTDDWSMDNGTPKSKIEDNYKKINDKKDNESPIVLAHELSSNTMDMFTKMYSSVKKAYKNIVPVTACMNVTNPYPEDITFPTFEEFTSGKIDPKNKPNIKEIKVDAQATFKPVALSKQTQKGSYMSPGSDSKSDNNKGAGSKKGSHSKNGSESDSKSDSDSDADTSAKDDSAKGSQSSDSGSAARSDAARSLTAIFFVVVSVAFFGVLK